MVRFSVSLALLAVAVGAGRADPEKIPPDRVVHPIIRGVSQPRILPEARKEPVYPENGRKLHLGAEVIRQIVIDKSGEVTDIRPLKTRVWIKTDCEEGGKDGKKKDRKETVVPPAASREFEESAVAAVKQWRYDPATLEGVPVSIHYTVILAFDPCPEPPDSLKPPPG